MRVLAIDTTAEFGSLALTRDGELLEEVLLHEPNGFSGSLFDQIHGLLARRDTALGEIDLFAAASGPGSFTGVRVGLAAIKGLAEVLSKPACAVSTLRAVASFGTADLRAPIIDARRGEVFAAVFGPGGDVPIPESVLKFSRLLELIGDREIEFVSSSFDPLLPAVAGTRFERCPVARAPRALASAIARIAERSAPESPLSIDANYVRRSDAELLWKA